MMVTAKTGITIMASVKVLKEVELLEVLMPEFLLEKQLLSQK